MSSQNEPEPQYFNEDYLRGCIAAHNAISSRLVQAFMDYGLTSDEIIFLGIIPEEYKQRNNNFSLGFRETIANIHEKLK